MKTRKIAKAAIKANFFHAGAVAPALEQQRMRAIKARRCTIPAAAVGARRPRRGWRCSNRPSKSCTAARWGRRKRAASPNRCCGWRPTDHRAEREDSESPHSGMMVAATPSGCDGEVRRSAEVAPFAVGLGLSGVGALDDPDRIAAEQ
jgi:hypothetical protein